MSEYQEVIKPRTDVASQANSQQQNEHLKPQKNEEETQATYLTEKKENLDNTRLKQTKQESNQKSKKTKTKNQQNNKPQQQQQKQQLTKNGIKNIQELKLHTTSQQKSQNQSSLKSKSLQHNYAIIQQSKRQKHCHSLNNSNELALENNQSSNNPPQNNQRELQHDEIQKSSSSPDQNFKSIQQQNADSIQQISEFSPHYHKQSVINRQGTQNIIKKQHNSSQQSKIFNKNIIILQKQSQKQQLKVHNAIKSPQNEQQKQQAKEQSLNHVQTQKTNLNDAKIHGQISERSMKLKNQSRIFSQNQINQPMNENLLMTQNQQAATKQIDVNNKKEQQIKQQDSIKLVEQNDNNQLKEKAQYAQYLKLKTRLKQLRLSFNTLYEHVNQFFGNSRISYVSRYKIEKYYNQEITQSDNQQNQISADMDMVNSLIQRFLPQNISQYSFNDDMVMEQSTLVNLCDLINIDENSFAINNYRQTKLIALDKTQKLALNKTQEEYDTQQQQYNQLQIRKKVKLAAQQFTNLQHTLLQQTYLNNKKRQCKIKQSKKRQKQRDFRHITSPLVQYHHQYVNKQVLVYMHNQNYQSQPKTPQQNGEDQPNELHELQQLMQRDIDNQSKNLSVQIEYDGSLIFQRKDQPFNINNQNRQIQQQNQINVNNQKKQQKQQQACVKNQNQNSKVQNKCQRFPFLLGSNEFIFRNCSLQLAQFISAENQSRFRNMYYLRKNIKSVSLINAAWTSMLNSPFPSRPIENIYHLPFQSSSFYTMIYPPYRLFIMVPLRTNINEQKYNNQKQSEDEDNEKSQMLDHNDYKNQHSRIIKQSPQNLLNDQKLKQNSLKQQIVDNVNDQNILSSLNQQKQSSNNNHKKQELYLSFRIQPTFRHYSISIFINLINSIPIIKYQMFIAQSYRLYKVILLKSKFPFITNYKQRTQTEKDMRQSSFQRCLQQQSQQLKQQFKKPASSDNNSDKNKNNNKNKNKELECHKHQSQQWKDRYYKFGIQYLDKMRETIQLISGFQVNSHLLLNIDFNSQNENYELNKTLIKIVNGLNSNEEKISQQKSPQSIYFSNILVPHQNKHIEQSEKSSKQQKSKYILSNIMKSQNLLIMSQAVLGMGIPSPKKSLDLINQNKQYHQNQDSINIIVQNLMLDIVSEISRQYNRQQNINNQTLMDINQKIEEQIRQSLRQNNIQCVLKQLNLSYNDNDLQSKQSLMINHNNKQTQLQLNQNNTNHNIKKQKNIKQSIKNKHQHMPFTQKQHISQSSKIEQNNQQQQQKIQQNTLLNLIIENFNNQNKFITQINNNNVVNNAISQNQYIFNLSQSIKNKNILVYANFSSNHSVNINQLYNPNQDLSNNSRNVMQQSQNIQQQNNIQPVNSENFLHLLDKLANPQFFQQIQSQNLQLYANIIQLIQNNNQNQSLDQRVKKIYQLIKKYYPI